MNQTPFFQGNTGKGTRVRYGVYCTVQHAYGGIQRGTNHGCEVVLYVSVGGRVGKDEIGRKGEVIGCIEGGF